MHVPNQIISEVILLCRVSMLGSAPFENIFVFLILGNEVREVFAYQSRGRPKSRSQMLFSTIINW